MKKTLILIPFSKEMCRAATEYRKLMDIDEKGQYQALHVDECVNFTEVVMEGLRDIKPGYFQCK